MSNDFLLVGSFLDSTWTEVLISALSPIGQLDTVLESNFSEQIHRKRYSLIIVDASGSRDIIGLVAALRQELPHIPIVIVTASPTWQRARQVFLAGATDYVRKSLNTEKILKTFQTILATAR